MKTREFKCYKEGKLITRKFLLNIRQTTRGEFYYNRQIEFAI